MSDLVGRSTSGSGFGCSLFCCSNSNCSLYNGKYSISILASSGVIFPDSRAMAKGSVVDFASKRERNDPALPNFKAFFIIFLVVLCFLLLGLNAATSPCGYEPLNISFKYPNILPVLLGACL